MTSVVDRTAPWSAMPGWGIFADLMPPELVAARGLKSLQKKILVVLIVVVLICAGGYGYALTKHSSAASALSQAQAKTTRITAEQGKYASVTQIQNTTREVQSQIAGVMTDEVDFAALLGKIRGALPGSMSITTTTLTMVATASTAAGVSLSGSGAARIGTVTIAGAGQTLDDLSTYVVALSKIPGVVDVIPSSNNSAGPITAFNLSFGITNELYTHRHDVKGGIN
jgi:hypothetical protein